MTPSLWMGPSIYFIHSAALPSVCLSPCVYMSPALIWINTVMLFKKFLKITHLNKLELLQVLHTIYHNLNTYCATICFKLHEMGSTSYLVHTPHPQLISVCGLIFKSIWLKFIQRVWSLHLVFKANYTTQLVLPCTFHSWMAKMATIQRNLVDPITHPFWIRPLYNLSDHYITCT